jgi:NAD(P)-dependent dehydrogenase (short-subunit alcohol dehydrogenase family)
VTACAFNPGAMDTDMQERIRRTASSDFPRADEYREAAREGRLIDPKAPARAIAYLVLPSTQRNGQVLEYDDDQLRSAVESALPG